MLLIVGIVLIVALFAGGLWGRKRCGMEVTSAYRTALAIVVCGVSSALVAAMIPLYVIVRRGIYGGSIADNLPSGVSEDVMLGLVVTGVAITITAAMNSYLDRIKSE